ncbi:MAG TPA: 50S ribosomal protein L11 methyltransferase, partial [Phnomibacter sp.]|nr:50S ribosomal protein L11 methyltransferase [Phnomibacter sp.]
EPVTVGHFAAVRAHFHAPVAGVQHQVIITPKMSFGTGHHATTYMMLQAMESLDFQQKRVVDFGTGTGVLAVLAQKLGAAHVLGIDNDAWSIENATENRTLNKAGGVQLLQADTFTAPWPADIILANINRNVLLEQAPALVAGLAANGTLVLSGILQQDETDIKNCFEQRGLQTFKQLERNNWLAIIFKKMTP